MRIGAFAFYVFLASTDLRPQTVSFSRRDTATLPQPQFIASGDFNGDGKLDIVVNNYVLLGNGDGSFQPPFVFGASDGAVVKVVSDFNGDGKLDLALTDNTIWLGNGDGTFLLTGRLLVDGYIVAAGDFNSDGRADLVAVNENTLSVLLGNGDGTFQSPVAYDVGKVARTSNLPALQVTVADFNTDGSQDLAVVVWTSPASAYLAALLGAGDGTFQEPIISQLPEPTGTAAAGDLNGDGIPDLVFPRVYDDHIWALLGRGDGTFGNAHKELAGISAASVALGDFNGDGILDAAVGEWHNIIDSTSDIQILLGTGYGTFWPALPVRVGELPGSVAVGDFNGDGKLDIVTTNYSSNSVSALLNSASR